MCSRGTGPMSNTVAPFEHGTFHSEKWGAGFLARATDFRYLELSPLKIAELRKEAQACDEGPL